MKRNKIIFIFFWLFLFMIGCEKESQGISDLQIVRNNNNKKTYPVNKMDSVQAIEFITKQKIQELLDLSTLYTSGKRDTEIDSVIYAQMKSYFADGGQDQLKPILKQLDSFKVKTAKVGNLLVSKEIKGKDTLDFAKFSVEYFDKDDKSLGVFEKNAQYTLKLTPVTFKKEFQFYFVDFDVKPPKDSTVVGVTK